MKTLITGGTGLLGSELFANLALGHAVHRPAFLPVPKTALRIAFGEMSEILMASQRVLPRVAERTGYAFKHTELEGALAAVMAAPQRSAA